ncbi:MAG: Tn7 transposase TnsA N-terminal domain-containing protein [Acholeplasmataceae bacterium]|nr:Tn7 transposase TnsA N-terminal domain-containing protein [Acholeplasmataceae bacterium]
MKIETALLKLVYKMEENKHKAYFTSMRTILRGRPGPISDLYEDQIFYGTHLDLTNNELRYTLDSLIHKGEILRRNSNNRKEFYIPFSHTYAEERVYLDKVFQIDIDSDQFYEDELDQFDDVRDVTMAETISKKTRLLIKTPLKTREVQCESSLEEEFVEDLNEYEYIKDICSQPLIIRRGKNQTKEYTPDFVILTYNNNVVLIEIKTLNEMTRRINLSKYKDLKRKAEEEGYCFSMLTKHNKKWISLEQLKVMNYDLVLESTILHALEMNQVFTHEEYMEYVHNHPDLGETDIHTIILKNNLVKRKMWNNMDLTYE